ncbi:MAG: hypothetical protein P1U35_13085 [Cycloclasticus sp.]|nr:hypothetical protein [Cycloclasticus sp.]
MIVSITFRHGTENKSLRRRVGVNCMLLAQMIPTITRVQEVFYKEARRNNASDLVTCHMSVDVPNKRHIDIYEHQSNQRLVFDQALAKVSNKLSRIKPLKSIDANERHAM